MSGLWARVGRLWEAVGGPREPTPRKRVEAFKSEWQEIMNFYDAILEYRDHDQDPLDNAELLHSLHIDARLDAMMQLLREEEEDLTCQEGTGPCLEVLLQQKIVDVLCALGEADRPPGMMALALRSLVLLFNGVRQKLLPHMTVHQPVFQFIRVYTESGTADTLGLFFDLIAALVIRLQEDPSLIQFFLRDTDETPDAGEREFLVFTGLLPYVNEDSNIGTRARAGLLCLLALPDGRISRYVAMHTSFCENLVSGLVDLYRVLPTVLPDTNTLSPAFPELDAFRDRLRYINQVAQTAGLSINQRLAEVLTERLFRPIIAPALLQMEEKASCAATIFVSKMSEDFTVPTLITALGKFLLDRKEGPEKEGEQQDIGLRTTLLRRIDSLSVDLSSATLKLFDTLLLHHNKFIMYNLVLDNLIPHAHIQPDKLDSVHMDTYLSVSSLLSRFQGLGPPNAEQGYDTYLHDAEVLFSMLFKAYRAWDEEFERTWEVEQTRGERRLSDDLSVLTRMSTQDLMAIEPSDLPPMPVSRTSRIFPPPTPPDGPFYEGLFLSVLFNRLSRMLDHPMNVNLMLTSVLSKLALCPHPVLQSFLLDSSLPVNDGVRTLPIVLAQVYEEAQKRGQRISHFEQDLEFVRRSLVLEDSDGGSGGAITVLETPTERRFLEAVVVLDEFIKELAAIIQAKNTGRSVCDVF